MWFVAGAMTKTKFARRAFLLYRRGKGVKIMDIMIKDDIVREIMQTDNMNECNKKAFMYRLVKKVADWTLAFLGLVVLSPIMLLAALAIIIEDGGPIFYTQIRIGKNKKEFKIYKFRSMRKDAEELHEQMKKEYGSDEVSFKLSDKEDPRILKVGYYLRKFNIDELPQLINILKGDMSLVGPRPLPKYEFLETEEKYGALYDARYSVNQGLTCIWQISNRSKVSFEERMKMDCDYSKISNIKIDISLIIRTFFYVITGKGEY